jgi:hypothetical protein
MSDTATASGPIWGPDSVTITTDDGDVAVRPDANNVALKEAGLPTRYYVQPNRVRLARADSGDYDFAMQAFVKGAPGTQIEYMGGTCTFSATLGMSEQAIAGVTQRLVAHNHPEPNQRIAALFNYEKSDPPPEVGFMPVQRSRLECVIDHPRNGPGPIVMTVANHGSGSIELQGRNSFLVTCSAAAADEIVTNLRDAAAPPFVIRYLLTEQFDTGLATAQTKLTVDVDKTYDALAATATAPLTGDTFEASYRAAVTSGAMRISSRDAEMLPWLEETDAVKTALFALVKEELFDIDPPTTAAVSDFGWWDTVFGGGSGVTLKKDHERRGIVLTQTLDVHGLVNAQQTVEGTLDDLSIAAKADIGKYLTVLNVGGF